MAKIVAAGEMPRRIAAQRGARHPLAACFDRACGWAKRPRQCEGGGQ